MIVTDSFIKRDCLARDYYQLSSNIIHYRACLDQTLYLETKYQIFMAEINAQKLDFQDSSQMFTRF